jgi:hypothetical protein
LRTGHVAKARADAAKAANTTRNRRRENMDQTPGRLCWFAWKMNAQLVLGPDIRVDDGKAGKIVGAASFFYDGAGVFENLIDRHGVHLPAIVVTGLDGVLQIPPGCLSRKIIRNDVAGTTLLFDPRQVRHRDPDGSVVDGEADVGGIGMPRRDSHHRPLPNAVKVFSGPAVGYFEVFIHDCF